MSGHFKKPVIVIEMDGGIITCVSGTIEADVIIVDFEINEFDEDQLSEIYDDLAYVKLEPLDTDVSTEFIELVYEAATEREEN